MIKSIALLISLLFPLTIYAETKPSKTPQQQTLSSPNGRYVFSQISEYRRDQYLLDTQTGRLWVIVSAGEDKPNRLQPVPYIQVGFGDESYIPDPMSDVETYQKFVRQQTLDQIKKNTESDKSN